MSLYTCKLLKKQCTKYENHYTYPPSYYKNISDFSFNFVSKYVNDNS